MGKLFLSILALLVAIITAAVILTITGVIHPQGLLINIAYSIDSIAPHLETYERGSDVESWQADEQRRLDEAWEQLEARNLELDRKKTQLADLETKLSIQENNLHQGLAEQQNRKKLIELYTEMTPEDAVNIFKVMDEDLALSIILGMDSRTAADILARLPSELAASLSAKFE